MHCDMRAFASQIVEEVKYSENREHPGNKENRETSYKKQLSFCTLSVTPSLSLCSSSHSQDILTLYHSELS